MFMSDAFTVTGIPLLKLGSRFHSFMICDKQIIIYSDFLIFQVSERVYSPMFFLVIFTTSLYLVK